MSMTTASPLPGRKRCLGFSLIEVTVALAVTGVLASVALPSFRAQQLRSHRADATGTLQRMQFAQEQYREQHGRYAQDLSQLPGAWSGRSMLGFYQVALVGQGPQGYELVAQAVGEQVKDNDCVTVRLRVEGALSFQEPSGRCWPT